MTTFLTLLTGAELAEARSALEKLAQKGRVQLCILDAEQAPVSLDFCQTLLPRELLGANWKDDAFSLEREQFTLLCAMAALEKLLPEGPVWLVHPALLEEVPELAPQVDFLAAWTADALHWDARCVGFGEGQAPRAFVEFALAKMRYALAQVNYVKFCRLRIPQLLCHWRFFDHWLDYAVYEGCRMQLLPGAAPAEKPWTPGTYRLDAFDDGTPVLWLLRELYSRDYRLRFACHGDPFAHQRRFLSETNWTGDECLVPLTAPMQQIYQARDDLAHMFSDLTGDARMAFAQWYVANAEQEYGLPEAYLAPVRAAYETRAAQLAEAAVDRRTFGQKVTDKLGRMLGRLPKTRGEAKPQFPKGVNICGFIQGDFGLGHSARILADDLANAEVPFTMVNYEVPGHTCNGHSWDEKISDRFLYNTNIFVMSPESLRLFVDDVAPDAIRNHYNIGYFYWELPEFPEEWVAGLDLMDEIWAASEFTREAFAKKTNTPIHILPGSIEETREEGLTRADFNLPEDKFLFLVMYDIQSVAQRKNPQGAVSAFEEAFGAREDVGLVLKVNPPRDWDGHDPVLDTLRGRPNIYLLAETYAKPRLNALVSLCDAAVSLHRSEGFGMCPAEAMYWGKPAVLTDWSGNQVYMTPENCCPVPCEIVEIEQDYGPYKKGCHWAEPDVHAAAEFLKRLVEDPEYYHAVAKRGEQTIRTQFSVETVGKRIRARLTEQGLL